MLGRLLDWCSGSDCTEIVRKVSVALFLPSLQHLFSPRLADIRRGHFPDSLVIPSLVAKLDEFPKAVGVAFRASARSHTLALPEGSSSNLPDKRQAISIRCWQLVHRRYACRLIGKKWLCNACFRCINLVGENVSNGSISLLRKRLHFFRWPKDLPHFQRYFPRGAPPRSLH
jgi:hypothetical protein